MDALRFGLDVAIDVITTVFDVDGLCDVGTILLTTFCGEDEG